MTASTGETVYSNCFWLSEVHTLPSAGPVRVTTGFSKTVMLASASASLLQLPSPWEALSFSVNVPGVQGLAGQLTNTVVTRESAPKQTQPRFRQSCAQFFCRVCAGTRDLLLPAA